MPDFTFTSPEGKNYTVTGPEGATKEQAFAMLQAQIAQGAQAASPPAQQQNRPLDWADVPGKSISNLPQSAGHFAGGIYQAIRHPIDTALNVGNVGYGAIRNMVPDSVGRMMDKVDGTATNPEVAAVTGKARQQSGAAGQFFKDRYGSEEGIKNTLATDPVGVASDASVLLTGGGGLAAKLPMLGRAGQAMQAVGEAINPINVAKVAALKALPKIGDVTASVVGNLGTHTGAESLKVAYQSGKQGGEVAKSVADNMRGKTPISDVLAQAKSGIEQMGRQKSAAYRQGMAQVSGDQTVLNFSGIDQALADARDAVSFKGQAKNDRAAAAHKAIADEIDNWKALDPAEYHTPEGLDALKQRVGGIVESLPFEEKTARLVGDKIYRSIKDEIVKQAPVYADTMKAYSEATEQIREIERTLSLGKRASVDTAMRKLQSLTRNNVNTNYGNRLKLAQELEQSGGVQIMPALAGQAMSSWTPRGLGSAVAGPSGLAGYSMFGPVGAASVLALQSPRLMGEAALAAGKAAGKVKKASELPRRALGALPLPATDLANYLYQAGQLPQQ